VSELKALVASGRLRYVLLGGPGGFPLPGVAGLGPRIPGPSTLFGSGSGPGPPLGGPLPNLGSGADAGVTAARTQWVQAHCSAVTVPGAARAEALYECT
jgi:hypothetical protein